ncbi:acyltransferase [Paucibacter sp. B2R-40]|uniref:acyltransferase family protein n=1 Tax=Paucibacter sp. B2R-40 TaxID=2893554 RepID=UPI0021E3D9D4|nr:acyltransferase [Paucibacter sp. B2R-40]MCV2354529.1 acyltransferase [Paucibacter sp. B2R-40]
MICRLSKNNFDLLRFIFASIVLIVHTYQLTGLTELSLITKYLSSEIAVRSFFIVSGFLILMSYERSKSLVEYFRKRFLRIYPAYAFTILIVAIGFFGVSSKNAPEYFAASWVSYVVSNLFFLNFLCPSLPGVFESNAISAVNGALWTLKIEVAFYIIVPIIAYTCRRSRPWLMLAIIYFASYYFPKLLNTGKLSGTPLGGSLSHQIPAQLCFFVAGSFFYYYIELFEKYLFYFLTFAIVVFLLRPFASVGPLEPFALATIVVFLGLYLYIGNFGKYGDFSYGIYIVHFPIIQLFIHFKLFEKSPWFFLISVFSFSLIASIFLWNFIESKFLNRKRS